MTPTNFFLDLEGFFVAVTVLCGDTVSLDLAVLFGLTVRFGFADFFGFVVRFGFAVFFGVMYMLAEYGTFEMANAIAFAQLNYPDW